MRGLIFQFLSSARVYGSEFSKGPDGAVCKFLTRDIGHLSEIIGGGGLKTGTYGPRMMMAIL